MNRFIHLGLGWIDDKAGGLERYQHGVCSQHAKMGCDVSAWVQSRVDIRADKYAYEVRGYASPDEPRKVKISKLKRLAAEHFPDGEFTVVSHHASVGEPLRRQLSRQPLVVHFQGPWADEAAIEGAPWWKTLLQRGMERRIYRAADRIITLSSAFRELLIERYRVKPERVHVIPGAIDAQAANPGVSREDARLELDLPQDRPVLVSVRRLVKRVGLDVLITALAILKQKQQLNDLLLCIGGAGPQRQELETLVDSHGLGANVRFLGFVPDHMLSRLYRAADLSVVPTQYLEGFGLVTIESMAAGTPCLVTPVGSLPEVLKSISPDLVARDPSAEAQAQTLADYFRGTLSVPHESECYQYVRETYDWSVIGPRVLELYRTATCSV